jgi:hypothetical protein
MKGETYRTLFRLNSTSSTGRGMNCVRSTWSVVWSLVVGYNVLMVTAAILTLIYERRKRRKGKKRMETQKRGIDE